VLRATRVLAASSPAGWIESERFEPVRFIRHSTRLRVHVICCGRCNLVDGTRVRSAFLVRAPLKVRTRP